MLSHSGRATHLKCLFSFSCPSYTAGSGDSFFCSSAAEDKYLKHSRLSKSVVWSWCPWDDPEMGAWAKHKANKNPHSASSTVYLNDCEVYHLRLYKTDMTETTRHDSQSVLSMNTETDVPYRAELEKRAHLKVKPNQRFNQNMSILSSFIQCHYNILCLNLLL